MWNSLPSVELEAREHASSFRSVKTTREILKFYEYQDRDPGSGYWGP